MSDLTKSGLGKAFKRISWNMKLGVTLSQFDSYNGILSITVTARVPSKWESSFFSGSAITNSEQALTNLFENNPELKLVQHSEFLECKEICNGKKFLSVNEKTKECSYQTSSIDDFPSPKLFEFPQHPDPDPKKSKSGGLDYILNARRGNQIRGRGILRNFHRNESQLDNGICHNEFVCVPMNCYVPTNCYLPTAYDETGKLVTRRLLGEFTSSYQVLAELLLMLGRRRSYVFSPDLSKRVFNVLLPPAVLSIPDSKAREGYLMIPILTFFGQPKGGFRRTISLSMVLIPERMELGVPRILSIDEMSLLLSTQDRFGSNL